MVSITARVRSMAYIKIGIRIRTSVRVRASARAVFRVILGLGFC